MRIGLVLIALLIGCSQNSPSEQRRELLRVPVSRSKARQPPRLDGWYDQQGNLLPSTDVFAGLRLPRGLELKRKSEFQRVYETHVPPNKLHWYFGARLTSAKMKRVSGSTTYVAAMPRNTSSGSGRFDVKITPNRTPKGKSRVDIRQILPRMPTPPIPQLVNQIKSARGFAD